MSANAADNTFPASGGKARRQVALVLAICGAVWALASALSIRSGDELRYPDEKDYQGLALNLVQHHAFLDEHLQPTAARPPGYPIVLSLIYSVWERPLAAKLFNAFACALTAFMLAALASFLGRGIAGLAAALLSLCYPLFAYTASTLYPQTLGTTLFVASVLLLLCVPRSGIATVGAGLLFGCLVLVIPSFLLVLPVFAGYLLLADRLNSASWCRRAALFLACAVLVLAPWTVRNGIRFKTFIPVSANSGLNLLLGNSLRTEADSGVNVDISNYLQEAAGMSQIEQDKFFKHCALAFIEQHPAAALKLYLGKAANYFNYRNRLYTQSEGSGFRDLVLLLTYYPLLLAALVRLCLYRRFRITLAEGFLYCLYFGNAFLSALFFTRIRFRIPFDALLIVLAAVFIGHLFSQGTHSAVRTPAAPLPRET